MNRERKPWLWEAAGGILSLLYPSRCAGCDRIDVRGLCRECISLLEFIKPESSCVCCGAPVIQNVAGPGRKCRECRKHPPSFKAASAGFRYAGPLSRAVVLWKYEGHRYLGEVLSRLLSEWVSENAPDWWESIDVVMPAPHHEKVLKRRGFSPSEDLAMHVSEDFGLSLLPRVLFKVKDTLPQAGLMRDIRMTNLNGSMHVFDGSMVEGRTVLVIDDVMTTGATLSECARALKDGGASRIYGLVLARQSEMGR